MPDTSPKQRRKKGVLPPEDLQKVVAERLRDVGVPAAEAESGIHREQLLGVAAGQLVLIGTVLRTERWIVGAAAAGTTRGRSA